MAYRIARADGDWTAAATWGAVDATSLLDDQASNTTLGITWASSQSFTPGAITIDGIAVKVASRTATPNGAATLDVRLAQGGTEVAGTAVSMLVTDVPSHIGSVGNTYSGCSVGWVFFRLAAPVTLAAATAYTVQACTSSGSQVALFRSTTVANWSRLLRTTTTGAPAAGDSLFIVGERTPAGGMDTRAVVYDETATTDYGGGSTVLASLGIGEGGAMSVPTTPSTDFRLRLSGVMQLWVRSTDDAAFTAGTVADPIPASSSFDLQFDCASDGDFGLVSYAPIIEMAGSPRTTGKAITVARLTAEAAASQDELAVDTDTGWLSGDEVAVAPTRRVAAQGERGTLSANATASLLTLSSNLSYAHDGDAAAKTQADVVLLTRNVRLSNVTAAAATYIYAQGTVAWTCSWVEFANCGYPTKPGFRLVGALTFTGNFCAFNGGEAAFFIAASSNTLEITLTDCVSMDVGSYLIDASQPVANLKLTRCVLLGSGSIKNGPYIGNASPDNRLEMAHCRFGGLGSIPTRLDGGTGLISDCEFYSNAGSPATLLINSSTLDVIVRDSLFWRNQSEGIFLASEQRTIVERCELWGNTAENVSVNSNEFGVAELVDCVLAGESSYATTLGVNMNGTSAVRLDGCSLGTASGSHVAHGSGDIAFNNQFVHILAINTTMATGTFGAPQIGSRIALQRAEGVLGDHSTTYYPNGVVAREGTVTHSAASSQRLTPAHAHAELWSAPKRFPVRVGRRLVLTVYVRIDGTYNGPAPRLRLRSNSAVGITSYTTLDTHSEVADAWEALTGQTPIALEDGVVEAYVDCAGTAGNVYVDDWTAVST